MGDSPKKTYLHWDRPLLTSATERLLTDFGERLVDLSDTLLLLPTLPALLTDTVRLPPLPRDTAHSIDESPTHTAVPALLKPARPLSELTTTPYPAPTTLTFTLPVVPIFTPTALLMDAAS